MILFYIYIHIYSISNLYRRVFIFFTEKLFLYLATFILFSYSMILKKKKKKNQRSQTWWNHSSTDQRQSIAKACTDPSKYFLITLTIAVGAHTTPLSIHRQQPPPSPSSDASLSPIAVIVSTDDRGIWKRGSSLATRRRKFRSLFARVSQKNGDESAPAD